MRSLKWVHITSAGINQIYDNPIYTETDDIIITNSSGIHGPQIAEWTIMNMLVARRHYNTTYEWQKEHRWGPTSALAGVRDHVQNTIGILGYGGIGRQGSLSPYSHVVSGHLLPMQLVAWQMPSVQRF